MNVTSATHADTAGSGTTSASTTSSTSSVFMQLLLAQLQNQDPMSPMDGNQLASQMVQLNLLDEVTQIQQDVAQLGSAPATGK
jgi:flagellar basal-body rod modification protein FlgD